MQEIIREEVINVVFSQNLKRKGIPLVIPEVVKKRRPDILVNLYGLKLLIEGRRHFLRNKLFRDIQIKLKEGYAEIGMAILYPDELYEIADISELDRKIDYSYFSGAIFFWTSKGIDKILFSDKKINDISEILMETFSIYIKNDILSDQINYIKNMFDSIIQDISHPDLWLSDEELLNKLRLALGIHISEKK